MTYRLTRLLASATTVLLLASGCAHRSNLGTALGEFRFGVKAARMSLWREARFRFERAISIEPGDAMARNNLAVAYEATGEFEKAREQYIEALRLNPADQHIQKNFSRFTEYYTKRKKEETPAAAPKPAATATSPAPAAPPAAPAAQPQPPAQNPPAQQQPAQTPPPAPPPPQTPPPSGGAQ